MLLGQQIIVVASTTKCCHVNKWDQPGIVAIPAVAAAGRVFRFFGRHPWNRNPQANATGARQREDASSAAGEPRDRSGAPDAGDILRAEQKSFALPEPAGKSDGEAEENRMAPKRTRRAASLRKTEERDAGPDENGGRSQRAPSRRSISPTCTIIWVFLSAARNCGCSRMSGAGLRATTSALRNTR